MRGVAISVTYNVQPLRTQPEINAFLFYLRCNKNDERAIFLFFIGINSDLHMSDITKLNKKDLDTEDYLFPSTRQ